MISSVITSLKTNNVRFNLWPEMVEERLELNSRWFNMLAKLEKQVFEQVVHISWERGSIYFDTVKIYLLGAHCKGEPSQAGHAFIPMVEYR